MKNGLFGQFGQGGAKAERVLPFGSIPAPAFIPGTTPALRRQVLAELARLRDRGKAKSVEQKANTFAFLSDRAPAHRRWDKKSKDQIDLLNGREEHPQTATL